MSGRAVNLTLFVLVIGEWFSGFGLFLAGSPGGAWIGWIHGAAGCALLVLLPWKARIILRTLRRRGIGWWAAPSLTLLGLLLVTLLIGVAWVKSGLPSLLGYPALTWHVAAAVLMLPLFFVHAGSLRPGPQPADFTRRRQMLRRSPVLLGGVLLWQGMASPSAVLPLQGDERRFTGSRDAGGVGNDFPRTSWLFDDPAPIDRETWRLTIDGVVDEPLMLRVADLAPDARIEATIDCTGGWYARRPWAGLAMAALIDRAGPRPGARSVVVRSTTGYSRRFSIEEARRAILAVAVDDVPLGHGHGAPLRLVLPGRRGYDWVKWVHEIELSRAPWWWNWPLPVR